MTFLLPLFEIPLSGSPQKFAISLNGTTWRLTFIYRDTAAAGGGGWIVDVNDAADNPVLCGVPLVTGADLLAQFAYLDFRGTLFVYSDGKPEAVPTFDNLGSGSHVMWVSQP